MFDLYGKSPRTATGERAFEGETLWARVEGVEGLAHGDVPARGHHAGAIHEQQVFGTEGTALEREGFLDKLTHLFGRKAA
jgi:hypothetical protein